MSSERTPKASALGDVCVKKLRERIPKLPKGEVNGIPAADPSYIDLLTSEEKTALTKKATPPKGRSVVDKLRVSRPPLADAPDWTDLAELISILEWSKNTEKNISRADQNEDTV